MIGPAAEWDGIRTTRGADGVLSITIDRPDVGNSLASPARDALTAALTAAATDPAARAVLLSATGSRHFCTGAGLDPGGAAGGTRRAGEVAELLRSGWQRLVAAVLDCPKPVVAAVNGTAAGAGGSLVLAADLVVMSETASLAEVFVRRGILPDAGACHLLPRVVGLRRATEILMLGEPLGAAECERLGIANRVVPADRLGQAAQDLAARLAAGPTTTLALIKRLLQTSTESARAGAFEQEALAQEIVSRTDDMAEGLAAFAERRSPSFVGF